MDRVKEKVPTPQAILLQAQQLSNDVRRMTAYRIDIPWLKSALVFLLRQQHIAVLVMPGMLPLRRAFLKEVIFSMHPLRFPFPEELVHLIAALVAQDEEAREEWEQFLHHQRKQYLIRKIVPWAAVIITIALCLFMHWYGEK